MYTSLTGLSLNISHFDMKKYGAVLYILLVTRQYIIVFNESFVIVIFDYYIPLNMKTNESQ